MNSLKAVSKYNKYWKNLLSDFMPMTRANDITVSRHRSLLF